MKRERIPNSGKWKPQPGILRRALTCRIPTWLATLIIVMVAAGPIGAQLQQSGGGGGAITSWGGGSLGAMANYGTSPGAVLVPGVNANVTNTPAVTQSGTWTVQPGNTANTTAWLVTGTGGTFPASQSGAWTVALNAGANIIGKTVPATACGTTVASQALAAVPTASTAVFTSTTCVMVILMNNTNASSATVTVTDNQATPVNDVLTFSIPANSQLIQPLWGVAFTTGVKWSASTTGVTGAVLGYQ